MMWHLQTTQDTKKTSTCINRHQQTSTGTSNSICQWLLVSTGVSECPILSCVDWRYPWEICGFTWRYLSIFCGCLRFSDVFGSYPSTSPLQNEAKTLFWGRPEIKDFFACSVWNIKISQNIKMSRYQLSKTPWVMPNLCFFMSVRG